MSNRVTLVVDGLNGADVARAGGIRSVNFEDTNPNTALVTTTQGPGTRDGQHGQRATRAIPGSPAGFIAVELSESTIHEGGLHVDVIGHRSIQRPPQEVEVPAQQDLFIQAVGGAGESGHVGGNGEPGMSGTDGAPATRESDATPGTIGGRGGDAGEGTNGGNGGDGGTIQIWVDANLTHLLLAVQWDVRGGPGGKEGRHGEPGQGGPGGKGGAGHRWEERVGYRYHCTSNCIGTTAVPSSPSSALTRVGGTLGSGTAALLAHSRTQVVSGGNLQAMIATVAERYGAMRRPVVSTTSCQCRGGTGTCIGCGTTPIIKEFERQRGLDGRHGLPGATMMTPLLPGSTGQTGSVTIIVRSQDGTQNQYSSIFNFELLDFEVEDGNADGIFEPGEYAIIKRIRVRNSGGMPSPTCRIPITIVSSKWFSPVPGEEGSTFISNSIPSGITVTLEGSIKVLIQQCENPPPRGERFSAQDILTIEATMPWLNRKLNGFGFGRTVEIQYPVELQNIRFLSTLAQGSRSNMTWQTFNKSAKPIGAVSSRQIEISVTINDVSCGELLSPNNQEWTATVVNDVDFLPAKGFVSNRQMLRIPPEAQTYQKVFVTLDLYISMPTSEPLDHETPLAIQLLQTEDLEILISPHFRHNPMADFLLVTNSATTHHQVQAIIHFISEHLRMEVDEWNVGLYGGLSYTPEEGQFTPETVLTKYSSKTIIFLGNKFDFFESGSLTIPQLCDTRDFAETCSRGTSILFAGSLGDVSYERLLKNIIFPLPGPTSVVKETISASTTFSRKRDLTKSISQQMLINSPAFTTHMIPIKPRWYRLGGANEHSEAKKVAKYLGKQLPQERTLVTATRSSSVLSENTTGQQTGKTKKQGKDLGSLLVFQGNPHRSTILVTDRQTLDHIPENAAQIQGTPQAAVGMQSQPQTVAFRLNLYESFVCVASLPPVKRVDIAWSNHAADGTQGMNYSPFALQAVCVSLCLDVSREIQNFLSGAGWPSKLPLAKEKHELKSFFRLHLPILYTLLHHPEAESAMALPGLLEGLLPNIEMSCLPQNKRQLVQVHLIPLSRRQSQLHKLITEAIDALLVRKGYTTKDTMSLHSKARKMHSTQRDTISCLNKFGAELTLKNDHAFVQGWRTASQLVPRVEFCKEAEWDARWEETENANRQANEKCEAARQILKRMILEA